MRQAGAPTIAQNEETCVVFGMPREAFRWGAVGVGALDDIPSRLVAGCCFRARSAFKYKKCQALVGINKGNHNNEHTAQFKIHSTVVTR